MKKVILNVVFGLFGTALFTPAFAQEEVISINPVEKKVTVNKVSADAWANPVNNVDDVKKSFTRYTKETLKVKMRKGDNGSLVAEMATIPQIATKRGDLHAIFSEDKGQAPEIAIVFAMGYDIFLNTQQNPSEMALLKEFTRSFLVYHYENIYNDKIKLKESLIKDYNKQIISNERNVKNANSDISSNERKIGKQKDAIKKVTLENKNVELRNNIKSFNEKNMNFKTEIEKAQADINTLRGSLGNLRK